jgi:hypothetical protein
MFAVIMALAGVDGKAWWSAQSPSWDAPFQFGKHQARGDLATFDNPVTPLELEKAGRVQFVQGQTAVAREGTAGKGAAAATSNDHPSANWSKKAGTKGATQKRKPVAILTLN